MNYLALGLLCIVAVELFLFFPILKSIASMAAVSQKSLRVLSSRRISDHWKEKVLKYYARDMARYSLATAFWLAFLFFLIAGCAYLLDLLTNEDASITQYAMSVEGMVLASFFAIIYAYMRKRLVSA